MLSGTVPGIGQYAGSVGGQHPFGIGLPKSSALVSSGAGQPVIQYGAFMNTIGFGVVITVGVPCGRGFGRGLRAALGI